MAYGFNYDSSRSRWKCPDGYRLYSSAISEAGHATADEFDSLNLLRWTEGAGVLPSTVGGWSKDRFKPITL